MDKSVLKLEKYLMRFEKKGQDIPLDPFSELYRECPFCEDAFMAENSQDIYCSVKCKDDYNNAQKRQQLRSSSSIVEPTPQSSIERNVEILDLHYTGGEEGMYITFEKLDKIGVDLLHNNGQGQLYNIDEKHRSKFLVIGPYKIYSLTFENVLVKKQ